ncbi:hypothetical protein LB456_09050 [Psychroflexus sp. CAK57W]|uniref:hypothetical protein n=2 Tax=Psychroflexus TaxID=83612 RepID=UPI001CCF3211|nr:hypothetical protein [Psychroflexus curvus]MBZ9787601.1 hypothetical protein [Psychroflexus curvus]
MAKKIFRLHQGGVTKETGWFKSSALTSTQLNSIKTDGKDVATSIPTPYASIDLVKSAFSWVAENDLRGKTAQHKLVSYALDIGQLFFAYPRFSEKLRIVAYNPKERFADLKNSNSSHRKYAETLKLFWEQDKAYNFDKTSRLYFLLNKQTNEILGSTSPSSLFMASPDVKYASKDLDIQIAHHKLFNNEFMPLFKRDKSFILYIYTLSKQAKFTEYFPDFYKYLEKVKQELSSDIIQKITEINASMLNEYEPCPVLDNVGNPCEVLDIQLGVQGAEKVESDFEIESDLKAKQKLPLILPQYPFGNKWNYLTGVVWDENTITPYRNESSINESRLPVQNVPHYWLTIGNFLEDKIIELPYNIDSSKFITCGSEKHLLPLTPTYFKYFSIESVENHISIKERAGGNIDVELKIPVKGGDIIFKKQYSNADKNIEKADIHLAIFPFLKSNKFDITHNIGVLDDRLDKSDEILLYEIKSGQKKMLSEPIIRNPGKGGELVSKYFKTISQPDVIGIYTKNVQSALVPRMNIYDGTSQIDFAIDFGTTNTHIEYKLDQNESIAFDMHNENSLIQSLLDNNLREIDPQLIDNEKTFETEILPFSLSDQGNVSFPIRTALAFNNDVKFAEEPEIVREVNNYFFYDKRRKPNHLKLETELKWSNYSNPLDENKVESYIKYIVQLAFYKTLQLNCNPASTSITWFYPVSMDEYELNIFFEIWESIFLNVFNKTTGLKGLPESVGPYLDYKSVIEGLSLSIDIGGGSSDIAVFDEDDLHPKLISSFKFAGNAILGDGYPSTQYKSNSDRNGFVRAFKEEAIKAIDTKDDNTKGELLNMLDEILVRTKNSSDFSNLLFSLENNKDFKFSYTKLLQKNDTIKLVFLIFYGAIAYYSATLLKKAGITKPKNILLSGTASKTANILDTSKNYKNLSAFFDFIFNEIHESDSTYDIKIKLSDKPKEITCKGALKADYEESVRDIPTKYWLGGSEDVFGKVIDKDKDFKITPQYGDLGDTSKNDICNSINHFYSILDDYIDKNNIQTKYMIDTKSYSVFKSLRSEGLTDLITRGINAYHKTKDTNIGETLFFYPLIGVMNKLAFELSSNSEKDE